jgi:hypothetical protein
MTRKGGNLRAKALISSRIRDALVFTRPPASFGDHPMMHCNSRPDRFNFPEFDDIARHSLHFRR